MTTNTDRAQIAALANAPDTHELQRLNRRDTAAHEAYRTRAETMSDMQTIAATEITAALAEENKRLRARLDVAREALRDGISNHRYDNQCGGQSDTKNDCEWCRCAKAALLDG